MNPQTTASLLYSKQGAITNCAVVGVREKTQISGFPLLFCDKKVSRFAFSFTHINGIVVSSLAGSPCLVRGNGNVSCGFSDDSSSL